MQVTLEPLFHGNRIENIVVAQLPQTSQNDNSSNIPHLTPHQLLPPIFNAHPLEYWNLQFMFIGNQTKMAHLFWKLSIASLEFLHPNNRFCGRVQCQCHHLRSRHPLNLLICNVMEIPIDVLQMMLKRSTKKKRSNKLGLEPNNLRHWR